MATWLMAVRVKRQLPLSRHRRVNLSAKAAAQFISNGAYGVLTINADDATYQASGKAGSAR